MSNERSTERFTNLTSFPPDYESTWQSAEWMENVIQPVNPNHAKAIDAFWEQHDDLYVFIKGMSAFRRRTEAWGIQHTRSYERGVIFAITAIEKKYMKETNVLPSITEEQLLSFFESLFILEGDNSALLETKVQLGLDMAEVLSPHKFVEGVDQSLMEPKLIAKLEKAFYVNRINQGHQMSREATCLDYHIKRNGFVSMFGPRPGLALGTTDAYTVFRQQHEENQAAEEIRKLNRMWKTEVK